MQPRPLSRGKKLERSEDSGPLVVPSGLLCVRRALRYVFPAPLELGLAMLPAHPHHLPPARRLLDHPDHVVRAALPAAAALQGTAAQRHRQLRARRVAGSGVVTAHGRGVPPANGELAPMLVAPAPNRGRMTIPAVPPAGPCSAPTALRATEADERERRREGKVVELIERFNAQESCLAALQERSCLTR